jgi:hypothetical protein
MTTINIDTTQLEYLKGRVDRFTARALEAEERYIWLYDSPTADAAELDFARWEYEVTLKELGRALNKYLNLQYSELYPGIDKRMRRAA